jgi:hypothetical protein
LLKRTGAYAQILRDRPASTEDDGLRSWTDKVRELGKNWRESLYSVHNFDDLTGEWRTVCESFTLRLSEVRNQRVLCEALMKLVAASDEASGVGAPKDRPKDEYNPVQEVGADLLTESGTLCGEIDRSRLRVLPRMHTPQNGLTERSLSHNLSLCDPSEVTQSMATQTISSN